MTIKGLIFDFDGLIIDTEMPCFVAWAELFNQHGLTFTKQDYGRIIGTDYTLFDPAKHLSQLTHGSLDPDSINIQIARRTRELIDLQQPLPGVLEFLQSSFEHDLLMGMASSSNKNWVEGYLSKLNLRNFFGTVCTSNDVKKVKPDPELYLLALKRMELSPAEVIALEDSPNGIKSAKAAGIKCIAIPNEITKTLDLSLADQVVNSFNDLKIEKLLFSNN